MAFLLMASSGLYAGITLEECIALAQENYPLIRKYDLLDQTKEVNLSAGCRKSVSTDREAYKTRRRPCRNHWPELSARAGPA